MYVALRKVRGATAEVVVKEKPKCFDWHDVVCSVVHTYSAVSDDRQIVVVYESVDSGMLKSGNYHHNNIHNTLALE